MKRIAIVLHKDGKLAPVDDAGHHFDIVKVFESDGALFEEAEFKFDGANGDRLLPVALKLAEVTDVIGQHFEEKCFETLKNEGIHMWLEAPDVDEKSALKAWLDEELPEATVGAHTVHGPEGREVRHEASRERVTRRESPNRGVSSPIHGPRRSRPMYRRPPWIEGRR